MTYNVFSGTLNPTQSINLFRGRMSFLLPNQQRQAARPVLYEKKSGNVTEFDMAGNQ